MFFLFVNLRSSCLFGDYFIKNRIKVWWFQENVVPLHRFYKARAFSSAGLEHLPYKQRVGGSNPSTPTSRVPLLHERCGTFSNIGMCSEDNKND